MAGAFDDLVPGSGTGAFDDLVPAKKKPGFLEGLKQFGTRLIDTEVEGIAQRRRTDLLAGADRSNAATQAAITRESTSLNPAEVEQAAQATQANTRFQSAPANVLTNAAGAGADLAQDLAVSGAKGVVGFGESAVGLGDLATGWTGVTPGGVLKDLAGYDPEATKKFLEGFNSDRGKADNAGLAKTKGFVDTLAELGGNPRLMAQQIFEALPGTIGSGAIGGAVANRFASGFLKEAASKGLVGAAAQQYVAKSMADNSARITKAVMLAAAAGEGAQSAGSIAETARQAGRDWEDYILPALGAGVGTAAIGLGANKLATKLGVGDIETDIALRGTGLSTGRTGPGSLPERVVVEGLKEGLLEEAPQSAQEAGFENVALGRPWDQGIAKATAMGLATGAGMGGGHAALSRAGQQIQEQAGGTPVAESQAPAPSGPGDGGVATTRAAASPEPTAAEKALLEPRTLTALDRVNEIDQEVEAARTRLADLNNPGSGYGPMFDAERAELASKAVELETERQGITKNWPAAVEGKPTDFSTEAGARVQAKYALMDVGDLQTSHDADLRPNPVYPTELQPRERERAASEMQISGIVQKLDPARLGLSADAANGAPIVGADGLVESGNARTIALKRIYQANGQKAADYKQFLKNNAAQFGLTPEQIDAAAKPVLVRVRTTPVNRAEFARQANASTVAMMSPSEQGKSDANRIDSLEDLVPDDNGDFTNTASRPFIRRFMARLPVTEQAGMIDSAGNLSTTGYARVRNAVLAKAYGDSPVLMRMTESMDNNLRNVSSALMMAAPKVAQMREAVQAGNRFDADITPDLMAAVEELSRLKESGASVEDALAQAGMFGDKYSPETRDLLQFLAENARRPRKMADFLVAYMAALDSLGDPNQGDLLGDTQAPAKADLMAAAKKETQDAAQKAPQDTQRRDADKNTPAGGQAGNQSETALSRGRSDQGAGPAGSKAEQVDEGWALFGKDSGTLGIPRAAMPQIKGEQRGALVNFLAARGIEHTNDTVPAKSLKPTQAEYSRTKVDKFKETGAIGERSVLVSSDGHVLDGHHQWLGMAELGQDIPVIRLGAPIVQLLDAVNEFPSVRRGEGGMTVRDQAVSDFKAALADLAQIATRQTRAAMIPEETPKLMDTLVRLFDAAIKIVGSDMKAALRYVKEQLRKDPENKKLVNFIKDSTYQKAALQAIEGQGQADPFAPTAPTVAMIDGRPYDAKRDNFKAQPASGFVPAELLTLANDLVDKYFKKKDDPAIDSQANEAAEAALAPLLAKAVQDKKAFDQAVIDVAKAHGIGQVLAKVKGIDRAVIKVVNDYQGDASQIGDLLRATVVVERYEDAGSVIAAIAKTLKVVKIKNKAGVDLSAIDGDAPVKNQDRAIFGGYADVSLVVRTASGLQAEIQINVPAMLAVKDDQGHKLYEAARAQPKDSERESEIDAVMQRVYDSAFAEATRRASLTQPKKAASELGAPRDTGSPGSATNSTDSSSSLNQPPSGNRTNSSPPNDDTNLQPSGNLLGSSITSPDAAILPLNGESGVGEAAPKSKPDKIDDFGKKLEGAKKDRAPSLSKDLTDEVIATEPFSKIWPADEVDGIEDAYAAAVAHTARAEVPSKPRTEYKLKRWVESVKAVRSLAQMIVSGKFTKAEFIEKMKERTRLKDFASKVELLDAIERGEWARIGEVIEAPNAYRYAEDGKTQIPAPTVGVRVDGRFHWLPGSGSVADQVDAVNALLGKPVAEKKMAFEVRGRGDTWGINKKGDKEYRKLKTFTNAKEAIAYRDGHYADLVAAWDAVKQSDNVKESDVRGADNRPRTAQDYRDGKDVTPQQFEQAFGFRGVQFGNWVDQGAGRKARQGMLNDAFDALMDLAAIVQVPPKALSLNGTLGLSFGARGSGWASAHYEPGNLVINLTKTRGAGTLAHEWFHALDNYFSHQRGGAIPMKRGMSQNDYRQSNYITYRPEPMYVRKDGKPGMLSKAQLDQAGASAGVNGYYKAENWHVDPKHPQGVRPEVERAFAELVEALNESPMAARAKAIDKVPNGYWSRIIELGARSFENYVITKMMERGYHNDYLANVRPLQEFARSKERYPYLLPDEVAPVAEAFDALFDTIETKEGEDGNVTMFSRGTGGGMDVNVLQAIAQRIKSTMPNMPTVRVLRSPADAPKALRDYIERQGAWNDVDGAMHKGELYLFASGLPDAMRAEHVLAEHEAAHFGLRAILGSSLNGAMQIIYNNNPAVRRAATALQARGKLTNAQATEEVLVDIPTAQLAKLTGWRKVVAKIRDGLTARGYEAMAGKLSAWLDGSLTEQQRADLFAADLVRAARGYVAGKVGGRYKVGSTGTRLSGTLADDVARQEKWLTAEAQARGYKDIDELAEKDYPLFENLAKLWRDRNPADMLLSRGETAGRKLSVKMDSQERLTITDPSNPGIILTTDPDPQDGDGRHMYADLELTSDEASAGGKGTATRLYMEALRIAQRNGMGWLTSSRASDATYRMYDRLERMGIPFVTDEYGGRSISPEALERIDLDRVENFYNWSRGTKVVDGKGLPLVVFHGTQREFEGGAFKGGGRSGVTFFAEDPEYSSAWANFKVQQPDGTAFPEQGQVMPVFLSIRNPYDATKDELGLMMLPDMDLYKKGVVDKLKRKGYDGAFWQDSPGKKVWVTFAPTQIKSAIGNRGTFDAADPDIRMSRAPAPATKPTAAQRAEAIIQTSAATAKPIDAVAKAVTRISGIDFVAGKVFDTAGDLLDLVLKKLPDGMGESLKAGLVSDYGVPESVIDQRAMMQGRQRVQLRQAGNLIDKLSTLTREESRIAYEWMNETDPKTIYRMMQGLPEESVKVLLDVQQMIDKLSKEAVRMGQLSPEAYEANKFAYLRRSYQKYTLDQTSVEKAGRARAISILGDQYRGRGLTEAASMKQIQNAAPDWWKRKMVAGKADVALKGEKFIRMERRAPSGTKTIPLAGITGKQDGKLLEVQYHPVGAPMPARYADWNQAGTFQVRDVKGDQVVLWRDFTKDERERMGEIDEARFAIAKTLQGMVHDVEVGRYLEWLAHTQAKKDGETIPGQVVEASEGYGHVFKPGEWVKVPDSKIQGTAVLKYGKLAGRYLPGPVWNDLRQVVGGQFRPFGETYGKLLSMWKTSKTALSPAVHTNNIMSNLVMADWHDVTAGHTAKALRILLGAHGRDAKGALGRAGNVAAGVLGNRDREAALEIMNRYLDSGGDIGSWATNEISQDQISPLLEQLERELAATNGGSAQAQVGIMAALQHALMLRFPSAWDAAKNSKPSQVVAGEGKALIGLYQAEDDVFRLAAWLKAKEEGRTDMEAGKIARRSFMDYSINAPWISALRNSALPFISYTYRAVPMMLETAAKKPHKLLKLMLLAGAVNALGVMIGGGGDDDERKLLPEEKAGRIWGMVPKLIRMPWNDVNGSPVYLDIRRFIPVGDVLDIGAGHAAVPLLPAMQPGGPLVILGEIIANRSMFTGKPINLETDTGMQATGKVVDHLWKAFAPNILGLPGTYATTGVLDAAKGKTDAFGREQSTAQAVASSFGVKLGSYPADVLRRNERAKAAAQVMEIDRNISALKRQRMTNRISNEDFQDQVRAENEKKRKVMQELQEKVSP